MNSGGTKRKEGDLNPPAERLSERLAGGKRSKLVGSIILADLLQYPLEKFMNFITDVEGLPLYKELTGKGIIIRQPLSGAKILKEEKESGAVPCGDGVIAKIKKDIDFNFSIHYTNEEFSIEYIVDEDKLRRIINDVNPVRCLLSNGVKLREREDISGLLHKLRRITTRNRITHEILKGILEYQRDYFEDGNENEMDLKLKPLQMTELARITSSKKNSYGRSFVIDTSRISRVTQGISIITPQGSEVSLKSLFPTKRDVVKRYIKVILNSEREDICNGRVKRPYTDEELRRKLKHEYKLSITGREVAYCRNHLGILPYSKRVNSYGYPPLLANFSKVYPLTSASVNNNAPTRPGVYELSLNGEMIEYPKGCCRIFYIGSANNLRKRLLEQLGSNNKNGGIKRFLKKGECVFRYFQVPKGWAGEEKNLYDLFISTYGNSPICNHVSPKASGG